MTLLLLPATYFLLTRVLFRINLPGVKDEAFAADCRAKMAEALKTIAEYSEKTAAKMEEALG